VLIQANFRVEEPKDIVDRGAKVPARSPLDLIPYIEHECVRPTESSHERRNNAPDFIWHYFLTIFLCREQVWVKVIEVDENGKVSLSMKLVNQETGLTTCLNQ
jgi:hypothetical protein